MTHPRELEHICSVCQKAFPEGRILKRHLKIHLDKKPHQCDQCDMSFAESSNLTKHKKKHTGELRNVKGKPYLCSVCGRAFKWPSSLSKHMKYHTGHKLLSCEYCSKQYVEVRSIYIKTVVYVFSIFLLIRQEVFGYIFGPTLEKDLTFVIYARKVLRSLAIWKNIYEFTLGRNLSFVLFAERGKINNKLF